MDRKQVGWSSPWKLQWFDVDPERREIARLKRVARWRGARVLDVGCGDGRLSAQLAELGARVFGIDPQPTQIRAARRRLARRLADRVEFRVGTLGSLMEPPGSFDIVLFSLSL